MLKKITATVQRNQERNGIEIKMSEQPPREVIDKLKAHGFRWSKRNKVWYVRHNNRLQQWAEDFVADFNKDTVATDPAAGMIQAQENSLFEAFEREL